MSDLPVLPDPELVVGAFLRGHSDVVALVGDRVVTRTPKTLDEPWVRIFLIDNTPQPSSRALHVSTALLQLDCYAGGDPDFGQAEASDIARTVQAALDEMPDFAHDGAVVSSAKPGSVRRLPDTEMEPARERYLLDLVLVLHP